MDNSQYGRALFVEDLSIQTSAQALERVKFSKSKVGDDYNEFWIQKLIDRHPSVLPVDQIEPNFKGLVPICLELPIKSGSFVDNLLITPEGDIALVECKLWRNPEARREVLAQIIDYASNMAGWSYEDLEKAVGRARQIDKSNGSARGLLFSLLSEGNEIGEAEFHDAVTKNLSLGRFLLLLVGDGIREGMDVMTDFLQQHAGFHFTLAFVELAIFSLPNGGYVVQPRVLARTTLIDRGVVYIDNGRAKVTAHEATPLGETTRRTTITQERFFEELEHTFKGITPQIEQLFTSLAQVDVVQDFVTASLVLRWRTGDGGNWNFGTITRRGEIWFDYLGQQSRSIGLIAAHHRYLRRIAESIPGASVKQTPSEAAWTVSFNGKTITIDLLTANQDRIGRWAEAIKEFEDAILASGQ
jgi:hypothetical protein